MRFLSIILVVALIVGCSEDEAPCEGWKYVGPVDSVEKYSGLFVDTRVNTLTDEIQLFQDADFCETPNAPSPGIYRIEGDVYENCQGKICVEITEWLEPYCVPEVVNRASEEELFGEWQLSHISTTDTIYYPDCDYGSFRINRDSLNYADLIHDADTTKWYDLGIGHGLCGYPALLRDSLIIGGPTGICFLAYPGYYHEYFRTRMEEVHINDTLSFSIQGNQLTLTNRSDSSAIHLFKE